MPGYTTNGYPSVTLPLTGAELLAVDTQLAAGASPQSESISTGQLLGVGAPFALTDAATITTNAQNGRAFSVTLGGNRTLANPTNMTPGQSYRWIITQDATGSRTLAYGTLFKFSGSSTLTTTASATDILTGYYDGTTIWATLAKAFA